MSKGNALTALKAKVKRLESDVAAKEQAAFESRQAVAKMQQALDLMATEGRQSLTQAVQAVKDLRSVNAELRDAIQETQEKRDQYRRYFKVALWVFAAYAVADLAFYLFLIWG